MLDRITRLQQALNGTETDRPPCICPGGMMNMVIRELMEQTGIGWPSAHSNAEHMAQLASSACTTGCFENIGLPFCMTVEAEALGAKVDLGTLTYEPRVVDYALESVAQWEQLPAVDYNTGRTRVVLEAITLLRQRFGHEVPIIGNLTGPMSLGGSLLEPATLYKELRRKPEASRAFLDSLCQHLLDFGLKQLEAGAHVLTISDPSGTAEILGPKLFAEYEVPALNTIIKGIRQAFPDAGIIVHICGKMHKAFDELAAIDCNAMSFDAVVNLKNARKSLPHRAIMGNVSTFALESGTPEKVAALTRHCLRSGADIIAPACGMGNASPLANVRAMLETVRNHPSGAQHAATAHS